MIHIEIPRRILDIFGMAFLAIPSFPLTYVALLCIYCMFWVEAGTWTMDEMAKAKAKAHTTARIGRASC